MNSVNQFFLLAMIFLPIDCRQMCWTCQYLRPGRGLECTTVPANWTGGESRMRCPTKCIITADYDSTSGEAKFFHRGCGESSQKDGCLDLGASHNCFFACEGNDYCNGQSLPRSPLLEGHGVNRSSQDSMPKDVIILTLTLAMLIKCQTLAIVSMY
ncbi:uncharacterized protein LOC106062621 [Biomphalaria glabrata]|uniref:Uncharacterized protein LOC106062621 n=1 Tax=Biomphalaria glabrata TaxID=6526 RepID=A0A9W3BJL1_BIOGL|nr:uncharacterized protein LOC106062621 [Biomphalaria glabrata]XP_055899702.1 uncharacterized protein LOC106062621 [Biomphalaria glabrata]XP_055899703.1 uncharacterized protein LOC106062621 [Biomphalaria glabrata]KAI8780513.1 hypothetical protein BgiBS90_017864 [Biomphalaria glabrata]